MTFQSTLPARGATPSEDIIKNGSPISIHAPRTGSDRTMPLSFFPTHPFQSTLPARGATRARRIAICSDGISIHAPRTGSDSRYKEDTMPEKHFNPRSPHGERLRRPAWRTCRSYFNPRSPHGERRRFAGSFAQPRDFNPRSPHGERQRKVTILSIRIIGFAQKVYHKTVLLRISLAENAVILPKRPQNPVRTSLQKAGGLRFARAIRAARPYSISSPSGA